MQNFTSKSILNSDSMKEQVKEVEKSLKAHKSITLLDAFLLPRDNQQIFEDETLTKAKLEFVTNPDPNYKSMGLGFDVTEVPYLKNRKDLLNFKAIQKILNEEKPDVREVEIASLHALKPMQAYAFKVLVLSCKGMKKYYKGMMPFTSQVRKASKILFDEDHSNQWRHTLLCFDLARELKTYPLYINSAMHIIGERITIKD